MPLTVSAWVSVGDVTVAAAKTVDGTAELSCDGAIGLVMSMLRLLFLPSLLYITVDFGGGNASSGANVWAAIGLFSEVKWHDACGGLVVLRSGSVPLERLSSEKSGSW